MIYGPLSNRWLLAGAATAALAISGPASAQDNALDMLENNRLQLVEIHTLHPSMTDQWDDSWMVFRSAAEKQGWPFSTAVYKSGPERWVVSYMDSFADTDRLYEARGELLEARAMERELEKYQAAESNVTSYFIRYQPSLSYTAEDDPVAPYVRVQTYPYKSGKYSAVEDFAKRYKAEMERLDYGASYQVHATSIGAPQPAIIVVTSAEDNLALAQERSEMDAALEPHEDKFERMAKGFYDSIVGSSQDFGMLMPDMSLMLDDG